MADTVSNSRRSQIMAAVRSKGNASTESVIVKLLRAGKIVGWRRHYPLPGRPDFAWLKQKVALFVDGCFWHGCDRCYREPKSNIEFWQKKIETNRRRDRRVSRELRALGWSVIRIRECAIKTNLGRQLATARLARKVAERAQANHG